MPTLDEQIAESLQQSLRSGELRTAKTWGKPLDLDDGFDDTPPELRMAFKVMKDAGFVPAEVVMLKRIADLRKELEGTVDEGDRQALSKRIGDMQQHVALRLERLRRTGSL